MSQRQRPIARQQRIARDIQSRAHALALLPHLVVAIWRTARTGPGPHVLADRPTWVIKRLVRMDFRGHDLMLQCLPRMAVTELLRRSITREPS